MIIRYKSALILLIFLASFAVVPAFASTPTPKSKDQVKVTVSSAALRAGPGFSYSSARYVYLGDVLTVYGVNPDASWYEVDQENKLWIAAIQVTPLNGALSNQVTQNIITTTQKTPTGNKSTESASSFGSNSQDTDTRSFSFLDKVNNLDLHEWFNLEKLKIPVGLIQEFVRQLIEDLPDWAITGLKIWLGTLGLLLLTFRFRWFFGALVFGLFLGPVGWAIDIYILIRLVFTRNFMDNYSPKELWDDILGSMPIVAISVILFLALTAVSILGGILIFGYLLLFVKIISLFLPGPRYSRNLIQEIPSRSESSNYQSSSDSSTDNEKDRDDKYIPEFINSNDDNDDDNKPEGGSLMDGWLIKW